MRSIIFKETKLTSVNKTAPVRITYVLWGVVTKKTKTTKHYRHIAVSCYIERKFYGVSARFCSAKPMSLPKNQTKAIEKLGPLLERMKHEAFVNSFGNYLESLKNLKAEVLYFDRNVGSGMVRVRETNTTHEVHACNLIGSKSFFSHLACTYLVEGEIISVAKIHPQCGVIVEDSTNVYFDAEQWETVRKGNHTFTQQDDGSFSGLFARAKEGES